MTSFHPPSGQATAARASLIVEDVGCIGRRRANSPTGARHQMAERDLARDPAGAATVMTRIDHFISSFESSFAVGTTPADRQPSVESLDDRMRLTTAPDPRRLIELRRRTVPPPTTGRAIHFIVSGQ